MKTRRYAIWVLVALIMGPAAAQSSKTPNPATTAYRTGTEFMRVGRWQKAISSLEKAAALAPNRADIQEALGGAYFDYAVDLSTQAAISPQENPTPEEKERADRVAKMMKTSETALKRAVELEPNAAAYHHTLGWYYLVNYWQHLFDAAAKVSEKVEIPVPASSASEKPKSSEGTKPTPEAETKTPTLDYAQLATQELRTAIRLAPREDDYYRSLGDAFRIIGGSDDSGSTDNSPDSSSEKASTNDPVLEQYQAALRANPNSAPLHYELYNSLMERSEIPSPEALNHLQKARQLDPSNALYGYELAVHLFAAGRDVEALNTLRSANLSPRFSISYVPAYPRHLAAGLEKLQLVQRDISAFSRLQTLGQAASYVARNLADYDAQAGLSAHEEVVRMGERIALQGDIAARLVGVALANMGLQEIMDRASWLNDWSAYERAWVRASQLRALADSQMEQLRAGSMKEPR